MKRNKKRILTMAVAVGCVLAILLSGTFAWQAISSALNEFTGTKDKVGSANLHDDFDKEDGTKKIYVENTGESTVFVRIKLEELMDLTNNDKTATTEEWILHIPISNGDTEDPSIDGYTNGEQALYHDSQAGYFLWTMEPGDPESYHSITDTQDWRDAISQNIKDQLVGDSLGAAINGSTPDSTIVDTSGAATKLTNKSDGVITMSDYLAKSDAERAAFQGWVYDQDGYAYWSQPLVSGEATGKLLDKVSMPENGSLDYYYAINVTMEYVDIADLDAWIGEGEDGARTINLNQSGQMLTSENDQGATIETGSQAGMTTIEATAKAKILLKEIAGITDPEVAATEINLGPLKDTIIEAGTTQASPTVTIIPANTTSRTVTWSSSNESIATVDAKTGLVTAIAQGEVTIFATIENKDGSKVTAEYTLSVITGSANLNIQGKPGETFMASGHEWVVLHKEGNYALIITTTHINDGSSGINFGNVNSYIGSLLEAYMKEFNTKLENYNPQTSGEKIISSAMQPVNIPTGNLPLSPYEMTIDGLSTVNTSGAKTCFALSYSEWIHYVYNKHYADKNDNTVWWSRTPGNDDLEVTTFFYNGEFIYGPEDITMWEFGVRPACWVAIKAN